MMSNSGTCTNVVGMVDRFTKEAKEIEAKLPKLRQLEMRQMQEILKLESGTAAAAP